MRRLNVWGTVAVPSRVGESLWFIFGLSIYSVNVLKADQHPLANYIDGNQYRCNTTCYASYFNYPNSVRLIFIICNGR